MSELIRVVEQDDERLIDARELHEALDVKSQFNEWISRRIEGYGYVEGEDYFSTLGESTGGRPEKKYMLTVGIAKELAIVENNEKGREIRKYLIQLEKAWNSEEAIVERAARIVEKSDIKLKHYGFAVGKLNGAIKTLKGIAGKAVKNQNIALATRNVYSAANELFMVLDPLIICGDAAQRHAGAIMLRDNLDRDALNSLTYEMGKRIGWGNLSKYYLTDGDMKQLPSNESEQLPSCDSE